MKTLFSQLSTCGLLIAIAALGLCTSIKALLAIGCRHMAVFAGTTLVILTVITAGLLLLP